MKRNRDEPGVWQETDAYCGSELVVKMFLRNLNCWKGRQTKSVTREWRKLWETANSTVYKAKRFLILWDISWVIDAFSLDKRWCNRRDWEIERNPQNRIKKSSCYGWTDGPSFTVHTLPQVPPPRKKYLSPENHPANSPAHCPRSYHQEK